jgi:hypothetical protein
MPARRAKQAEHAPVSLVSTTPPAPDERAEKADLVGGVDGAPPGISRLYAKVEDHF